MNKPVPRLFKKYFLTGLFVLTPLFFTAFMAVWLVRTVDGFVAGPLGLDLPGVGLLLTILLLVLTGFLMSNLFVQQAFEWFEEALLHIPGVRLVYKTVKSLTDAFSPANRQAFRHVVLVEYPHPGALAIAFVTGHTELDDGSGPRRRVAVYVPTNHLYIGNTLFVPEEKVWHTDLSVQQGIELVLASGAGFPERAALKRPS